MYFKKFKVSDCVIYNIWRNNRDDLYNNNFETVFNQQLLLSEYKLNPGDKLIVNCCNEGLGPDDLKQTIATFEKYDFRVLFNAHITVPLSYRYETFVDHFSAHCDFVRFNQSLDVEWEKLIPARNFISLNRRASEGRCRLAKKLLDTFDHSTFFISCGSQPDPFLDSRDNLHKIMHPYTLPILLDGEVGGMDEQHNHTDTSWFSCPINVVTETSNQTDADSWHEIFITEKSLKAFLYRQLPVFWAVPGTVQLLRDIGFDLYDDVIDHSYDNIVNEEQRLQKVISTLDNLISNNDVLNLRKRLWNRIEKNLNHLIDLSKQHATKFENYIIELSQ